MLFCQQFCLLFLSSQLNMNLFMIKIVQGRRGYKGLPGMIGYRGKKVSTVMTSERFCHLN